MAIFCFDFVNTLAYIHEKTSVRISNILLRDFNLVALPNEIERNLRVLDEEFYFSSVTMITKEAKKEFYLVKNRELLKSLGILDERIAEKIFEELMENKGEWKLFPETKETLQKLLENGHTLVLASNFDTDLKSILRELEILHYFRMVHVSAEVNAEKPDEAFFKLLINKIESDSQDIFFVGDNFTLDYVPALNSGLTPILLDPYRIHPTINRRIEKLDQLLKLF
jgi:FMN phosphatase YigB (HAD superfamily)